MSACRMIFGIETHVTFLRVTAGGISGEPADLLRALAESDNPCKTGTIRSIFSASI